MTSPRYATHDNTCWSLSAEQNLVRISAAMLDMFYRHLGINKHTIGQQCENMTSSTKPEIDNLSKCRRWGPSYGHRQHAWWIHPCDFQVMRADRQKNRQTDILITVLCILPRAK